MVRSQHVFAGPGLKVGASAGALAIIANVMLQALPTFRPAEFPLGVAVQFGVALTIVGLQWDIFSLVKTTTRQRDRANRLMAALEVSDIHEEQLVNLCEAVAEIFEEKNLPEFVMADVESTIENLAIELGELLGNKKLRLNNPKHLMGYLKKLSSESEISILGTSALEGVDSKFWEGEEGREYLAIQGDRRNDSSKIVLRRIFLVAPQHDLDDTANKKGLLHLISDHEAAGFEIGVLYEARFEDFVIFNEEVVVYSDRGAHGDEAVGGLADFSKERAKARTAQFNQSWHVASENRKKLNLKKVAG